jgi:hypothetical protein
MIREGFRRIAVLTRWGGTCVSAYVLALIIWDYRKYGPESVNDPLYIVCLLVPGLGGWALAWLIDGFTQKTP